MRPMYSGLVRERVLGQAERRRAACGPRGQTNRAKARRAIDGPMMEAGRARSTDNSLCFVKILEHGNRTARQTPLLDVVSGLVTAAQDEPAISGRNRSQRSQALGRNARIHGTMTRRFFGYRQGLQGSLGAEFQVALNEVLLTLGNREFFPGMSRSRARLGERYWSHEPVQRQLRALVGFTWWPPHSGLPEWTADSDRQLFQLVEAMHDIALESRREEYTAVINGLFRRFNQPFHLVDGEVRSTRSEVLSAMVEELPTTDEELRGLLARAAGDFSYVRRFAASKPWILWPTRWSGRRPCWAAARRPL